MRKFFSLIAAVLFAGGMMATTVTLNYAGKGYENNTPLDGVEIVEGGVTFMLAKATGTTAPAYYTTGTGARTYGGNTLSINAGTETITKIVFDFSQNNKDYTVDSGTYTKASSEWVGSASSVLFTTESGSGHNRIKSITVTLGAAEPTVATPVIAGDETFEESVEVSITCATEGAAILYTTDDAAELNAFVAYTAALSLTESATVRAYAVLGEDTSAVVSKTFTKVEPLVAISCLEVYQKAKNDAVLLNPVTVTYSNGANVWVMDGSVSMLIYLPSGFTNNFNAGDVLTGVAGVVDIYQTLVYEVKPSADQAAAIVATPGEAPAPSQAAVIEATDVNKYVILPGFSIEGAFTADAKTSLTAVLGENTVTIYNNFKFAYTFEAGKTYNITGVVSAYKGNPQVYFISAVEADPTAINNTNVEAETVKFFENGQLFINKNGVIYNAQGTIVR